ncbi:NlpC/P60 family protein [bacterium]|nr:MAG: NlpC/P60 family protein [bacterium]
MSPLVAAVAISPALRMQTTSGVLLRHFQESGQPDRIVVGGPTGDVYGFDTRTGRHAWTLPGGGAPVRDVCRVQGRVFWFEKDSDQVRCVTPTFEPISISMSENGLPGNVTALDEWRGQLIVQTDQGVLAMDPKSLKVRTAKEVFTADVAKILEQGPCKFLWRGDQGLIVSFRHYGRYENPPETDGVRDITLVNAWSCDKAGHHTFLGGYAASITDYRPTEGPRVFRKQGDTIIDLPHGHSDLENVTVGPEGVVAVLKSKVLTIPFAKSGWKGGETLDMRVTPNYAPGTSLASSSVWFPSGNRWVMGSLEDGDCTVLAPQKSSIRQLVADESGAFALTDAGVSRLDPDDESSLKKIGVVAYELGSVDNLNSDQRRLREAMKKSLAGKNLKGVLKAAKLNAAVKKMAKPLNVASLEYGDLVLDGKETKLYVGDGMVASITNGFPTGPLVIGSDTRFARILAPDATDSAYAVAAGAGLLGYIAPIGINHPLAPGASYARAVPGASFDRPYLPGHFALEALIPDWIGTPYVWGGTSKGDGCDCSGFVQGVFREMSIGLPRHSQDIGRARRGMIVTGDLHYGDVLVFPSPRHVAIYIGNGQTAEAVRGGVGYSSISRRRLAVVRRFIL